MHGERWALGTNHDFVVDIECLKYIWDDQARKSVRQLETMVKLRKEVRAEDKDLEVTAITIAVLKNENTRE